MLNVGDIIKLRRAFEDDVLPVGAEGAIIMRFDEPSEGYEVEFFDEEGHIKAILTLEPSDFDLVRQEK
ncbi:DUF4926 domain-containing protein [Leptogranulimonas caecicola]|uniref:DUF4926 domain-containing protein n=1 Tax=Leptogranulimonas caecicola TaxID=2894156 RepID=A0AAU9C2Q0_9ACTN|nr:DUF4926 domain-containing protein [Leptogranulimonas caecicola]BCV18073.1 hypothetical protein ATOBIA_N03630 [Atopobiaceae bacterium P1]BDC90480.1 hypothetical protein ATTO_03520 [Leptogranulimonas caecicola]